MRNTKDQAPHTRKLSNHKLQRGGVAGRIGIGSVGFLWDLEHGFWCFHVGVWSLVFGVFTLAAQDAGTPSASLRKQIQARINQEYPGLLDLYRHLHTHPELSLHEEKTGQRVADELQRIGFEVTTRVGGYGVVGVLRNGSHPTILIRAD